MTIEIDDVYERFARDYGNIDLKTIEQNASHPAASELADLEDVSIANAQSGQVLALGSDGLWKAATVSGSGDPISLEDYYTKEQADTLINAKYTKPAGNIPATDLTSAVQTSLSKADSSIQSVNSKTGSTVTLTYTDVNAAATVHTHAISDITALQSALDGKASTASISGFYSKPAGGIPNTDLTSGARTSLGKADSSIQSVNSKTGSSVTLTNTDVGAAATVHTHVQSDVTGLVAALNDKATVTSVSDLDTRVTNVEEIPHTLVSLDDVDSTGATTGYFLTKTDTGYAFAAGPENSGITESQADARYYQQGQVDTLISAKYTKPGSGIPSTDLTSAIQTSITSANSAVQTVNSKSGTSITLTNTDVGAAATSHSHAQSDVTGLATALGNKLDTSQKGAVSGLATLDGSGILPSAQLTVHNHDTLYYTKSQVDTAVSTKADSSSLSSYILNSTKGAANGVVPLSASTLVDIGYIPTGTSGSTVALGNHTHSTYVDLTTDQTVAGTKTFSAALVASTVPSIGNHLTNKTYVDIQVATKYTKPGTGIPSTDLTTAIQTSLGKADSAVQSVNSKTGSSISLALSDIGVDVSTVQTGQVLTRTSGGYGFSTISPGIDQTTADGRYVQQTDINTTVAGLTTGKIAYAQIPTGTTGSTVAIGNHTHTGYEQTANKDIANGYAGLNGSGLLAFAEIPTGTSSSTVAIGNHTHTNYADLSTDQTVAGNKTFSGTISVPTPSSPAHAVTKTYVDTAISGKADSSALSGYLPTSQKAAASGVASLDNNTRVPVAQLGSGTGSTSNYLRGDGAWTALTTADISSGTFAIAQIPTGTSGTTVALGNHTHSTYVDLSTTQTIAGAKTFSGSVVVPTPSAPTSPTTKTYVDTALGLKADSTALSSYYTKTESDANYLLASTKAVINGVASLDSSTLVPKAQLGTGTASSANYLRGDGTWTAAPVTSVASKTGAVTLAATDIASGTFAIARIPTGTTSTTVSLGNHTHALSTLSDVTIATPATQQVLMYNTSTSKWNNTTRPATIRVGHGSYSAIGTDQAGDIYIDLDSGNIVQV